MRGTQPGREPNRTPCTRTCAPTPSNGRPRSQRTEDPARSSNRSGCRSPDPRAPATTLRVPAPATIGAVALRMGDTSIPGAILGVVEVERSARCDRLPAQTADRASPIHNRDEPGAKRPMRGTESSIRRRKSQSSAFLPQGQKSRCGGHLRVAHIKNDLHRGGLGDGAGLTTRAVGNTPARSGQQERDDCRVSLAPDLLKPPSFPAFSRGNGRGWKRTPALKKACT